MASERLYGLNALRANPSLVAHSVTGTVDQGMSGEGLFTTFRELKPGTTDAMFEAWAPLRLCLFAGPLHVYRGTPVKLEAVLANEDALPPGDYPVRLTVVGRHMQRVFDRVVTVKIPPTADATEPPFAVPIFDESVTLDVPHGVYRFLATMERGGAPAGGETVFFVADPAEMPEIQTEVVLWGDDAELKQWLDTHHIKTRPFTAEPTAARELILVGTTPATGGVEVWRDLVRHIACGSSVVFLSPAGLPARERCNAVAPAQEQGDHPGAAGRGSITKMTGRNITRVCRPALRRHAGLCVLSRDHSRRGLCGPGPTHTSDRGLE